MPVRAVVSPKFTYGQATNYVRIYRGPNTGTAWLNGMFDYRQIDSLMQHIVLMPPIEFPLVGNGHSARKSNRITITSVRVRMQFQAQPAILLRAGWFGDNIAVTSPSANIPFNPTMFMKFRLFLVQVDDDIEINEKKILNWFYATHCYYRQPSSPEYVAGPSETSVTSTPPPVSVHSSVLRLTTPWTGKFNVLADRKFTVKATKPQFDIDMTIPLRKEFVFDEDYTANSKLLYPKLYLFILPPLSFEVDVDPYTADYCRTTHLSEEDVTTAFRVYSWTKLNFVDL